MKKLIKATVAASLIFAVSGLGLSVQAADEAPAAPQTITQAEAIKELVNLLGLYAFLPANPSLTQCTAALTAQGISPIGGWLAENMAKELTTGDFAVVLAKALGLKVAADQLDNQQAYVDALAEQGIAVETYAAGKEEVKALQELVAAGVVGSTVSSDPVSQRDIIGQPDEETLGGDVSVEMTTSAVSVPPVTDLPVTVEGFRSAIARVVTPTTQSPTTPN